MTNMYAPIGQQLLDVPFPAMVQSMGLAIAEAQYNLDLVGIRLAQLMSGSYEVQVPDPADETKTITQVKDARVDFAGSRYSLLELGFTPTFYQFVDTLIEIKISISTTYQSSYEYKNSHVGVSLISGFFGFGGGAKLSVSSVSAAYASKFQYSAEGSSLLRTKLVPVPAPAVLEERIRRLLDLETQVRIMPDLDGKTWKVARELLHKLGIGYDLGSATPADTDTVNGQTPDAGKLLEQGELAQITI
ncbi:MAG TPA: PASTA domain-containing protein [Enhygromyxa sp.]|nr:PASTA domain-containing protein [Enhygromyxa sp.]